MNGQIVTGERQKHTGRVPVIVDLARRRVRGAVRAPVSFIRRVSGGIRRRVEGRLLRLALERPRYAPLYYLVADRSFDREMHAVLHGRMAHRDQENSLANEAFRFTLRRDTHRLEKGLLMRPRRPVFAEGYIEETTLAFSRVVAASTEPEEAGGPAEPDPLLLWADDVLGEYFGVVADTEVIRKCRDQYREARARMNRGGECVVPTERRIPYRRLDGRPEISIDDLAALAKRRRSVRWFEPRPVPRAMIDRALEVALQSPSACNRQPFVFHVFDEPTLVQQVCEIPMGTKGYRHNIPAIAVIVGRQRAYFSERDRHLIYIDGSLAAMGFMYALEVQGLSSCPINWPDIEEKEQQMADLIGLGPDERPVMLVAIGYPDLEGLVAYSQKKPLDEARTFNHVRRPG